MLSLKNLKSLLYKTKTEKSTSKALSTLPLPIVWSIISSKYMLRTKALNNLNLLQYLIDTELCLSA